MSVEEFAHVGVVVSDLEAATAFFVELGLEAADAWESGGEWVDRVIGLEGTSARSRMLLSPRGGTCIELSEFGSPPSLGADTGAPSNSLGIRHVTFQVDDLDDTLKRLEARGASMVGEVANYQDVFRVCYVRGPDENIVELAERID